MKSILSPIVLVALALPALATVTMDWVTIGNPGNAADPRTDRSINGVVNYDYRIGKYEVTNVQYCAFLNAKGTSNSKDIYSSRMYWSGSITQTGSSGNFSYSVTSGFENKPVVHVSWFDAARFANWMMNGQGSNDMETGAYTLNGATSGIITANIGAQVYIPSESEWYKAAYYNAASTSYSLYPNGQNMITTADANYGSNGSRNVGYYSEDPSFYGTFDQGGNVWEWTDDLTSPSERGVRGGGWQLFQGETDFALHSSYRRFENPINESQSTGFRLASAIPEPTSMLLSIFAGGMMLIRQKR